MDIGCNDGAQLNYFKKLGMETYGIDPAKNLFSISSKKHKIICDFINKKYTDTINKPNLTLIKSEPSELFTLHPMLITK